MKKNLRYFMTLLLMMVASVGWAESKTEGFEAKAATTTYNGTVTVSEAESDCGIGWSIYYGTVSTNDKISGTKSAQMRWYSNAADNYPYMMSTTPVNGLTNVGLKARTSSLDVKMDISYSADGETWTVGTTYTFNATGKGEAVSLDIPSGNKYVKFGVSSSSTAPASGNYKLIVDDVVFTYENASSLQDPGLAFASSEQTITLGDPFTLPELTNNGDGTVTFTSSNTAVATIDSSTGEVEVLKAGKTVFTASSAETETYNAGRATFTLTVNPVSTPIEDGVFDFTGVQAYGTGLTPTSDNSYIEETKTWTAGNVTLVTSGKYRWWYAESGNTLRVFAPSEGNTTLTLSVPEGNVISQIVITGNSDCKTLVSNIGTYDTDNYTWTGKAQTVVISRGDKNAQIKTITVTYGVGTGKQDLGLAFSSTTATANIGETFTAPILSYTEGFDGTITYSSSNTDVATVDATGDVTILAVGETTITATFAGDDTYEEGSSSYTLTVIDPNAPGASADNPYTVAQVLDLFENGEVPTSEVYVKGTISNIKSLDVSKYKRAQYYISDDGTTENQFYVYNGYYLDGADFTANDQIMVGDNVVIYGKLTTYSGTNEFAANNYIVSLNRPGEAKFYLVGSFNMEEDGTTWKTNDDTYKFTNNTVTASMTQGTTFKVIKNVDGEISWYGAAADGDAYWVNEENATNIALVDGKDFYMTADGSYTFTLDPDAMTLTITGWPETEYNLLGSFNEWTASDDNKLTKGENGIYTITTTVEAGATFKIKDSKGTWYGAEADGNFWLTIDNHTNIATKTDNGSNFYLENAGTYTFTFNTNDKTLTVDGTAFIGTVTEGCGIYQKVTSAEELEAGKRYLIVYENDEAKAYGGIAENTTYGSAVEATINGDLIDASVSTTVRPVALFASGTNWFIKDGDSFFSWTSGNSLALSDELNNSSTWTIAYSDGTCTITNVGTSERKLKYNSSSPRFACYTSAQTDVVLYKELTEAPSVTLSPAKEYTTLTSAYPLDFSAVDGLAAYIVKEEDVTATSVKLTQVSKVPANTGLVIQKTGTEDSYSVPVLTGDPDDVSENKMVGSATTTTAIAENAGYILKDGKFSPSAEGTLAAGKAYLAVSVLAGAKDLNIVFGEGTGINNVNVNENESGKIFNLAGQQMKSAVKGVYIKNGKKYIK